ncbi:MAG: ABC transporter permease, partial [Terriglobales bacterium]
GRAAQPRGVPRPSTLEHAAQDLRFGLRLLRKSPGFTVTAVLLLALGIGANAGIFSMVDWLLLRPLSVPDAGQLSYLVADNLNNGLANGFSYPNFNDIRQQSSAVFTQVAGVQPFQMDGIAAAGATSTFWANYVSGNFFALLGIQPALGRFFAAMPSQEAAAPPELVLSYAYWQSHFGGRASVIGSQVRVNSKPVTIVGVAPRGFSGVLAILDTQGYLPFAPDLAGELGASGDFFHERGNGAGMLIIGRRRPGVTLAQTQPVLQVIGQRLASQYPKDAPWRGLRAVQLTSAPPGAAAARGGNPLLGVAALFLGLAGLVLLLACVNIANLLLARAGLRQRELALRAALGAGRGRLLRQMLTESLLLAFLGGAGGLAVAAGSCHALNLLPIGSDVPVLLNFAVSWRVFLYACAVALGTGIAVGIVPALQASRLSPQAVLAGARGAAPVRTRMRAALVVAEIAGSLTLLIVAGLFVRSLGRAQHVDLG